MKILVTGAAGRVGTDLCCRLLAAGHELVPVDVIPSPHDTIRLEYENILDPLACMRLMRGVQAVVHLANHTKAELSTPQKVYGENCTMNMNICEAAHAHRVPKIVFASSIQVISGSRKLDDGSQSCLQYLPLDAHVPQNPGNCYALSKAAGENLLRHYVERGIRTGIALRLPWLIRNVSRFMQVLDGRTIPRRDSDWLNPDEGFLVMSYADAARALLACVESEVAGFRSYIVAGDRPFLHKWTPDELRAAHFPHVPWRASGSGHSTLCDVSEFTRDTGWTPTPFSDLEGHRAAVHPYPFGY